MGSVIRCSLPKHALLLKYSERGGYADCYRIDVGRTMSQAHYVQAFYTTFVFKLERQLLSWVVSKPSTDEEARLLAAGTSDRFAGWRVEARADNQLLMRDYTGRTRSWLMAESLDSDGRTATRLYFGSAVVPVIDTKTGMRTLGFTFNALLGFHQLYSRVLLSAAERKLANQTLHA